MKFNKILIALALCAGMQSNVSFGSQKPQNQSYWQRTKNYAASWVPQSVKSVGAAAALNKDRMLDRASDFFQPSVIRQFKQAMRSAFKIYKKIYEVLVSDRDDRDKRKLVEVLTRESDDMVENIDRLLHQAIDVEGFSQDYLDKIVQHLNALYGLSKEELYVLSVTRYYGIF